MGAQPDNTERLNSAPETLAIDVPDVRCGHKATCIGWSHRRILADFGCRIGGSDRCTLRPTS